ncbi:MAG: type III secretion chaperone [Waddliaceae bacterium]|nr:type III secretion chaperone [Waddliaceae bacterium]
MANKNWSDILGWGEDQVEDLRFTGYAYLRQGKYEIALNFFQALVVLDPLSAYDRQTLGGIYLEMNEIEKAIRELESSLKLEPDHGPTLLNLCKCLLQKGKVKEGLKYARKLRKNEDRYIANMAKALLLAYS